jgi:hypothetical protein
MLMVTIFNPGMKLILSYGREFDLLSLAELKATEVGHLLTGIVSTTLLFEPSIIEIVFEY